MEALEELVELAPRRILQDQEDAGLVVEPGEEAEDVRVVQAVLDLDLPPEMGVGSVLLQLRLEDHLQCHDVSTLTTDFDAKKSIRERKKGSFARNGRIRGWWPGSNRTCFSLAR